MHESVQCSQHMSTQTQLAVFIIHNKKKPYEIEGTVFVFRGQTEVWVISD